MQIERIARFALAGLSFVFVAISAPRALAVCGDGVLESATESCDDGNILPKDGCNANCQIEAGYVCTGTLCCYQEAATAFALRGNASLNRASGEITLAPDQVNQVGVAWFRQTLDFTNPFRIAVRLYLGSNDGGADGGSVLFQRDPRGINAEGLYGAELGAQGIVPVVGVEFDTFDNGSEYKDSGGSIFQPSPTTGDEDHLSVFHTRTTPASNHLGQRRCLNDATACTNFEDGKYHAFMVEWTGNANHHLKVYVDGKLRIDLADDLVGKYFAGNPARIFFGFAASTGTYHNLHKFCPVVPEGFTIPRDRDGDGVDDRLDQDDDGDGRPDAAETNDAFGTTDPGLDDDNDSTPNYNDPDYWRDVLMKPAECPDVAPPIGACDTLPKSVDFDGDHIPDHIDLDSDGDTVSDVIEDGGKDERTQDVVPPTMVPDGKLDDCTVAATGLCMGPRPPLPDTDMDEAIDSRDTDSDADLVLDGMDSARLDPCLPNAASPACAPSGGNDPDRDGALNETSPADLDPCVPSVNVPACALANPMADRDGDMIINSGECTSQSCPDTDKDSLLDFNDPDSDGDGTPDLTDSARLDPCLPDPASDACTAAIAGADRDRDTTPFPLDPQPLNPCVPEVNVPACALSEPMGDRDGDKVINRDECRSMENCPDTDRDGSLDFNDTDSDADGVLDGPDSARLDPCLPNPASPACGGSGSTDVDRDTEPNASDIAPLDPCMPKVNVPACGLIAPTEDRDGDNVANSVECSSFQSCPDTDGDGLLDFNDPDSDGDGAPDATDPARLDPCLPDPASPACTDPDRDGTPNETDPEDLDPCIPSVNVAACALFDPTGDRDGDSVINSVECTSLQSCPDTDGDGPLDFNDPDSDGDGAPDATDPARLDPCLPDPASPACTDPDRDGALNEDPPAHLDPCVPSVNVPACGLADPTGDRDSDTVANSVECMSFESCPDTDGDGQLDFNDADSDGDGSMDAGDPGRIDPCNPDPKNLYCAQGDFDQDGLTNRVECPNLSACPDSNRDGKPDYQDPDQDGDEVYDGADSAPRDPCVPNAKVLACANSDTDGDGVKNPNDPKPTDPCVPDRNNLMCREGDNDGDGLLNGFECANPSSCVDTDGDGEANWKDLDSDGDGALDHAECNGTDCTGDADADGTPDVLDPDLPQIAGGACSVDPSLGGRANANLGWVLTVLLATLVGRRWQRRAQR